MQHLCGVASMIVSPEGALSPEGKNRWWQSSRGGYNHAGNPTEMLHLFYYTEQRHTTQSCDILLPHFLKAACCLGCCHYCTHKGYYEGSMLFSLSLFSTMRQYPCWRRHSAQALTYFRHAWGSWKHDVLNNRGNHETVGLQFTVPWQRGSLRRMVTAVKEPTETQVASIFDTWLSSNRIRVSSREV